MREHKKEYTGERKYRISDDDVIWDQHAPRWNSSLHQNRGIEPYGDRRITGGGRWHLHTKRYATETEN